MKKVVFTMGFIFGFLFGQQSELKNVKVLPYTKKRDLVKYMKSVVASELGVKCNFCHNLSDYSSDEKGHKKVAREMMAMTINANKTMKDLNFHEISCWVCHRGENHPLNRPKKKN
ncbi:MAG: c-type cytochrome [Candidatus Marinimicrobia bacterium]|nr:c-type cytochrome [Candidatus Neomarinimicrobiota bacterium]